MKCRTRVIIPRLVARSFAWSSRAARSSSCTLGLWPNSGLTGTEPAQSTVWFRLRPVTFAPYPGRFHERSSITRVGPVARDWIRSLTAPLTILAGMVRAPSRHSWDSRYRGGTPHASRRSSPLPPRWIALLSGNRWTLQVTARPGPERLLAQRKSILKFLGPCESLQKLLIVADWNFPYLGAKVNR